MTREELIAYAALGLWEGKTDSDGMPCVYDNFYYCEECEYEWSDQWSCCCDDQCVMCGNYTSPDRSLLWDPETGDWVED